MPHRWVPCRAAEPAHGAGMAVLLVALFGVLGVMTRLFCADTGGYSSFWPANAVMVAALLTLRARHAIPTLAACFCLNIALNGLSHLPGGEGLVACVINVLEAVLVAIPTRRFCGALTDLTRIRRLATFGVVSALATGVAAAIGVTLDAVFMNDRATLASDWLQWVLCDTLGLLLATPTVMLAVRRIGGRRLPRGPTIEPLLLLILTAALSLAGFLYPRSFLFLLLYPAMVALAFRAPAPWVLTTMLIVSIFVSMLTVHGMGPIAFLSLDGAMMRQAMLQPYLLSLFLSALPPSNALGERRRAARRLARMRANVEHAATHDALTALMCRQLFKNRLAAHAQTGAAGALLFIDLDHFKRVNDTFGHHAGDLILQAFSRRIAERARGLDGAAARFGGDEFALFVPRDLSVAELDRLCADIVHVARLPYQAGDDTVLLTVSVGAATLAMAAGDPDDLFRKADLALYGAKDGGRDGYRLDRTAEARSAVEARYRSVLASDAATMPATTASNGALKRSSAASAVPISATSPQSATLPVQSGS